MTLIECNIEEIIHSTIMFLNHKFICCYSNSTSDYFSGTQKAPISWNDPSTVGPVQARANSEPSPGRWPRASSTGLKISCVFPLPGQ